jgi:hypothetical protein
MLVALFGNSSGGLTGSKVGLWAGNCQYKSIE